MEQTLLELGKAFDEFKRTNDARLKEIELKGHASADYDAKLDRINEAMAKLETEIANYVEMQNRVDELEAIVARPGGLGGSEAAEAEMKDARVFYACVRAQTLDDVSVDETDLEGYRNYKSAFMMHMRKGQKLSVDQQNALKVGADPDGGYWVTPDMTGRIATLIFESSPIRSIANVMTIGTDSIEGFNDLDEAGSGWVGEEQARPETGTPQIGKWKIDVMEQYSNPKATQKMLDDAFNDIEGWLEAKIAAKLARTENTAFVLGNGVLKPRGFLTYPHGVPAKATWDVVEQTPSGAAGAFVAAPNSGDAIINMVFGLKAAYRAGAQFVMNRSSVGEIRKLKDGDGNYLWQRDFESLQGGRLLGFPITEAEDMPNIAADSLSIAFGNFAEAYQIIDRAGIRVLRDPFTDKPNVLFYTTKRVGGKVVNFEALKLMKFATSV